METTKLSSIVQIITAVSVLIGLGLVIWELQQVKTLTRAQLTSESTASNNAIHSALLGEEPAAALAKACTNPTELTLQEAMILEAYYLANTNLLARLALHSDRDNVYEKGYWREAMWYLNPILASDYGREWLRDRREGWPSSMYQAMHEQLATIGPAWCESDFQKRVDRLKDSE